MRNLLLGTTTFSILAGLLVSCGGDKDAIVVVSRMNNSGTYVYFQEAVLGKTTNFRATTLNQSGSKDVAALVGKTPSAIGYSGMGYATDAIKLLAVSEKKGGPAVAPTPANTRDGSYPIARPLFIYTAGQPEGPVKEFLEWTMSAEGQAFVESEGYVSVSAAGQHTGPGTTEPYTIQVNGSDTMVNLAGVWAEAYSKKYPHVKVEIAGGGSGVGISALIDGKISIANASRQMTPKEIALATEKTGKTPVEFVVGKDGLGVYVHKDNPIDSISIEELKEIFGEGGSITKWSQLSASAVASK